MGDSPATELELDQSEAPDRESLLNADAGSLWMATNEALESGYLTEGTDQPDGPSAHRVFSARDLNIGVWVELIVEGQWLRAQLTWASPHRTLFMFVARGGSAHSMSRRTMERLRMQGAIRVVSEGHLVDQALDAVAQAALRNDGGEGRNPH